MDCPFDLNHNSCGHDEDAGVRCSSSTTGKSDNIYLFNFNDQCS